MGHLRLPSLLAIAFTTAAAHVIHRSTIRGPPSVFLNASQPTPHLVSSNRSETYFPTIVLEPGDLPDNLPPQNESGSNVMINGNRVGTNLYGYNGCRRPGFSRAKINDAYIDQWHLTNRDGIMKNIDWDSAAALEFLGPPANNEGYQGRIQDHYDKVASIIYSWRNPFVHWIHVRCDDPMKQCSTQCAPSDGNSDQDGGTIAYTLQEDPDDGYSMINFCPPFFWMRRLDSAAIDYGKRQPRPLNYWIKNYDNTARVFLHELFHLDYFMAVNRANHITDLSISFMEYEEGKEIIRNKIAYGPRYTKMMAKFEELDNPIGRPVGSYVMRNADNLAWYAMAKYVQDQIVTYPHLPTIFKKINGPPFKQRLIETFTSNENPVFDLPLAANETSSGNAMPILSIDDRLPDDNSCSDDLTSDRSNNADIDNLNISGLANDDVYPPEYMANLTSWLKTDSGVNPATTGTTATPASSTPPPVCLGNQAESSCIGRPFPSATPYTGSQGPICGQADGAPGSSPRLNLRVAQNAARQYCQRLVDEEVVLSDGTGAPKPATEAKVAEGGADMVLTVIYDVSSCPQDHSNSTLDFGALGVDACFNHLFNAVSEACVEDRSWIHYDPQWTLDGGIYAVSCGLFALNGVLG